MCSVKKFTQGTTKECSPVSFFFFYRASSKFLWITPCIRGTYGPAVEITARHTNIFEKWEFPQAQSGSMTYWYCMILLASCVKELLFSQVRTVVHNKCKKKLTFTLKSMFQPYTMFTRLLTPAFLGLFNPGNIMSLVILVNKDGEKM